MQGWSETSKRECAEVAKGVPDQGVVIIGHPDGLDGKRVRLIRDDENLT